MTPFLDSDGVLAYANIVHAQSRRFFWQGADREDVEQEAWLALVVAQPSSPQLAKTIIRRRLRDRLRNEQRRPQFSLLDERHEGPSFSEHMETRERLRGLIEAPLPPSERRALGRILNDLPLLGKADDQARFRLRRRLFATEGAAS